MNPVRTIVVGVDGSAASLAAVEWTVGVAQALSARVVAVHALGLLDRLTPDGPKVAAQPHREEINEVFENQWCGPLATSGLDFDRQLIDGNPVSVMLATIEAEGADLAVVGARGAGQAPSHLLGSTSTQLALRADIPVTIL
ncbi:MAG: universal stress protein [Actinomycetia bacterium]|nr:universal stress protein [Actinomycetes bacterium]MCP4087020.1 universal stress protein [Actinomycetes bacterium]